MSAIAIALPVNGWEPLHACEGTRRLLPLQGGNMTQVVQDLSQNGSLQSDKSCKVYEWRAIRLQG